MKKILKLLLFVMIAVIPCFAFNDITSFAEGNLNSGLGQKVVPSDIKDYNLRTYLNSLNVTLGNDGSLYENSFAGVTELMLSDRNIETLEGLEKFNFAALTTLDFSNNKITKIPVDAFYSMKNLEVLDLSNNLLTSINLEFYAQNIDLTHNSLTDLNLKNKNLKLIDISYNKFKYSNKITITEANEADYEIIAYYNSMAGNSTLKNAYLGFQNIIGLASKKSDCDYEMYSNSSGYKLFVYPFKDVCIGKDENDELIYSRVKCVLSMLNRQTNEYEVVKVFNSNGTIENDTYEDYLPKTGYYKVEFLTMNDEPIYAIDENGDFIMERDYNDNLCKVIDDDFGTFIVKAKPCEINNVYFYDVKNPKIWYPLELAAKGPITLKLCSKIPNVTYRYLLNGEGKDRIDGVAVPFEGDEIYIDQSSYYTLTVWLIEDGVESDFINFAININVPRKITLENWIFLILGALALLGGCILYFISLNKKDMNKDINDFEW